MRTIITGEGVELKLSFEEYAELHEYLRKDYGARMINPVVEKNVRAYAENFGNDRRARTPAIRHKSKMPAL